MGVKINNEGIWINEKLVTSDESSSSGGSGVLLFENINGDTTAENGKFYLADVTDGGFTITLPDSPNDNDIVKIANYKGSFEENNLTIDGNGKNINGGDTYTCSLEATTYVLQYSEDNDEWICLIDNSFKATSLPSEFICDIPTLSNQSDTEVNERDYIEIDIDNYEDGITYIPDTDLVTKIVLKSGTTFKIYFGSVDDDLDLDFKIRAYRDGYITSLWSEVISVTIKDIPEEEDDSIINDAFADNEDSSSDADVTNDKVTFTADGGIYKEVITQQGDDEENWSSYQTIARIGLDKMTIIDEDTDTDTLAVKDENIKNVSKCYIANDDYPNGVEIDIGDITEEDGEDTTKVKDVFDDGTCVALFTFDDTTDEIDGDFTGNAEDSGGASVDPIYSDVKYGYGIDSQGNYCINLNDDVYDTVKIDFNIVISAFVVLNNDETEMLIYNTGGQSNGFGIGIYDNKVRVVNQDGGSKDVLDGSIVLENDKVYHICMNFDADNKHIQVWVNKELDIDSDFSYYPDSRDAYAFINCTNADTTFWDDAGPHITDSQIAQVRFFKDKLVNDDELNILYDEQPTKYKADISSNELDNAPTSAYFIEENVTISTALTKDSDPIDPDDFNDETLDTWSIDTDNDYKENTYQKVSDYSGNEFQRKVTGDENANIIYLESKMWKDS